MATFLQTNQHNNQATSAANEPFIPGNPKTLTPGPQTTYGPVHGLPQRTPSTDHPPKYNKINK